MSKKVFISGIQPSGKPHIGNYFGAMKQFVDLQETHEGYIFIADYHALHSLRNPIEMKENIIGIILDYLAIGLDPKKVTLFKQSDISEHTELCWIFDTITTVPYLMRGHAYKDAAAKDKEIDVGTFNYPVLMAADILLYDTDIVPVGADQKQHVEYARDTAQKFNRIFGETFKLPKELIVGDIFTEKGSMIGLDGYKMSKSRKNTIPLFASDEEIKKLVMKIVTDSGINGALNVSTIHTPVRKALFQREGKYSNDSELTKATGDYLKELYTRNGEKYKELKEALAADLIEFIKPMRDKRNELEKNIPAVLEILKNGGEKAKKIASAKMDEVREKVGVKLY